MAGTFEFKSNGKSIAIGFTDQQLSPHAGSALFWGWLRPLDWCQRLAAAMPHPLPVSNNKLLPLEKGLAFMHGLLCDARKLTHVAYLRRDPLVPELLGIRRVASQSVLTRFFQGFASAGDNLRCFRPLWHWCLDRLPSQIRLRGVRADAGFCLPELLALWEQLKLPYVVVAQLSQPIQKLIKGDLTWTATEVPGTEVAELEYQAMSWPQPRRLVLLRHRVNDEEERGGKRLLDVPGYRFQALVTSLPRATHPPLAVWRYYNGRADCENVIKELQAGFALPTLCLERFWASEAALSLATLTYNLVVLFERHLGWQHKVTLRNLRFWLFVTAGVLSRPAGKTTIKLAVPERERDWWRRLWEKILSPFPNCNAVENQPAFTA